MSVGLHYQYLYLRICICVFVYLYAVKYIVVVGSVLVCRTTLLIESAVHLSNKLLSIKSPFGQIALFLSTDLPHDIKSVRTFFHSSWNSHPNLTDRVDFAIYTLYHTVCIIHKRVFRDLY